MIPDNKVRRMVTFDRDTAAAIGELASLLRLRQSTIIEAALGWYNRVHCSHFLANGDTETLRKLIQKDAAGDANMGHQVIMERLFGDRKDGERVRRQRAVGGRDG